MKTFKKLYFLLNIHQRKRAGLLLMMILFMGILDMIGVASVMPFMAVLTNPNLIETNIILKYMYQTSSIFGVKNNQQFLFILGILLFFILIFTLAFKAIVTYVQLRFLLMLEHTIGKRLVEGYLHQPYSWFLNRHSADFGKTILSESGKIAGRGIGNFMDLVTKIVLTVAITILLIIVDPKLALIIGATLGISYIVIFFSVNTYLKRIGDESLKNNELRFTAVTEAFSAVKEIKIGGLEQIYIKNFSNSSRIFALTQASASITAQLPRFFLESLGFGGVLLIILYSMAKEGSFSSALPIVSLYVFAGYRLLPALQMIYSSFTQLVFISSSLDKLHDDLKSLTPPKENQDKGVLFFNKKISLKNIHYKYPNSSRRALDNISLSIPLNSTIGLIGATGCGKTTLVDIIMGLLEPQKGSLEVDDKIITKQNLRSWQRLIGYVPQHIYLSDDTVAANIAFGVELKDVDQESIEKVSKTANLHEFVIEELPKQYETKIGERGIRLSGGQRQRIGIARALYHRPKVLILDEATSALDNKTEKLVMDALNTFSKDITTVIIAHRLSTVINCDKIFILEKGKLKNEGTFQELININENFRIKGNN